VQTIPIKFLYIMSCLTHIISRQIVKATVFCLVSIVAISACKRSEPRARTARNEWLKERLLTPNPAKVSILAIKHGISNPIATDVIKTYISRHDMVYQLLFANKSPNNQNKEPSNTTMDQPIVSETLSELSKKHGVADKVAASLIYEYSIWNDIDSRQ
jgi:hypothetical protein